MYEWLKILSLLGNDSDIISPQVISKPFHARAVITCRINIGKRIRISGKINIESRIDGNKGLFNQHCRFSPRE